MKYAERFFRVITDLGALIGVSSIAGLILLTVVTVVFRAIGIAFPGTYVLAELLLIPVVSFSLAYAAYQGTHTRVELLVDQLPKRVATLIEAAMTALGTLFWIFIAQSAVREALIRAAENERAPILNFPVSPFRWLMIFALVMLIAVMVFQTIKALMGQSAYKLEEAGSDK